LMPRWLDFALAFLLLLLTAPIWIFLAIWIRLDSEGPALFRQLRVGKAGKPFYLFKFRSMVDRAWEKGNVTAQADSRITRVGKIVRITKLDELPQLFNVLKGEMAFVGPRPDVPELVANFTPRAAEVLDYTPGLTSPGTLFYFLEMEDEIPAEDAMDFYTENHMEKRARLDLRYLQKRTVLDDLGLIFFKTPLAIAKKAYGQIGEHPKKKKPAAPPLFAEPAIKEKIPA